jgi:phosphatidylserine/phosphatidylglycerophosphate/cardiolipin synthase-like enzyme
VIDSSRQSYFTPYDDAQTPLVALLQSATKKIRLADYSFNLEPVAQVLIAKHQAGLDVQVVLDKSQSAGSSEVPEVTQLKAAGVPLAIGGSDKGKIMHLKVTIIDDAIVASGSYNYTGTAELEDNFEDIERNVERAAAFTAYWQKVWDWIENKK